MLQRFLWFLCQQKLTGAVYVTHFLSTDSTQCCQLCFVCMFFVYLANNLLFLVNQNKSTIHYLSTNKILCKHNWKLIFSPAQSAMLHTHTHTQLHICTATSLTNCYTLFYQPRIFIMFHTWHTERDLLQTNAVHPSIILTIHSFHQNFLSICIASSPYFDSKWQTDTLKLNF